MLRASSGTQGMAVDVKGVVERGSRRVGVPHEAILLGFADAVVLRDQSGIEAARIELARALGAAAVVDAACVVGNFERMNRIADACGIALGGLEFIGDQSLRELEIDHFNSADNSQPTRGIKGLLMRFVGKRMLAKMQRDASAANARKYKSQNE